MPIIQAPLAVAFQIGTKTAREAPAAGIPHLYYMSQTRSSPIIVAGQPPDCNFLAGTLDFQGAPSILEDTTGCPSANNGSVQNVDPLLGPLANNGDSTWTHSLPMNSPAVDVIAANEYGCGTIIQDDQRGEIRPFDGNQDETAACDLGAFELILNFIHLPVAFK